MALSSSPIVESLGWLSSGGGGGSLASVGDDGGGDAAAPWPSEGPWRCSRQQGGRHHRSRAGKGLSPVCESEFFFHPPASVTLSSTPPPFQKNAQAFFFSNFSLLDPNCLLALFLLCPSIRLREQPERASALASCPKKHGPGRRVRALSF